MEWTVERGGGGWPGAHRIRARTCQFAPYLSRAGSRVTFTVPAVVTVVRAGRVIDSSWSNLEASPRITMILSSLANSSRQTIRTPRRGLETNLLQLRFVERSPFFFFFFFFFCCCCFRLVCRFGSSRWGPRTRWNMHASIPKFRKTRVRVSVPTTDSSVQLSRHVETLLRNVGSFSNFSIDNGR